MKEIFLSIEDAKTSHVWISSTNSGYRSLCGEAEATPAQVADASSNAERCTECFIHLFSKPTVVRSKTDVLSNA